MFNYTSCDLMFHVKQAAEVQCIVIYAANHTHSRRMKWDVEPEACTPRTHLFVGILSDLEMMDGMALFHL